MAQWVLAENTGRCPLTADWAFCATPPAAIAGIADLSHMQGWKTAPSLGSVAAILRQLGDWSLDAPLKRFDAEDWWFRLSFDVQAYNPEDKVVLGFDGLATLAEVWLNGVHLLSSSNMFLQHQVQISPYLRAQTNELVIVFRSLDHYLAPRRPRPRWRVPMLVQQQLRWVRTTLLGRMPGWSTTEIVGAWRDIWIECRQAITLKSLSLRPTVEGTSGKLAIRCGFDCLPTDVLRVILILTRHGQPIEIELKPVGGLFIAESILADVALWWPHTHGKPALYKAVLQVNTAHSKQVSFDLGSIGFRTVHVERKDDSFSIHINGIPVFCRGACWTPLDPVTLHVSKGQYDATIAQVRAAGMNMLRVGGTMAYEADAFYAACAEQGIMVWQEFMFASMDYPDDADFRASAQLEAEQQLRRWQACPALTVLCGNSEVAQQAAMWGAPREFWSPPLFHALLAEVSQRICPDVPYWPSSAYDGAFPHQSNVGTTSYYGVSAYLHPITDARRSQVAFATECLAFANVPETQNIQKIPSPAGAIEVHHPHWKERSPRNLGVGWDFEDVRDHYLASFFGVDPLQLRYVDHERYLLLSRVVSGEIMAATFNEWRSNYSKCQGGLVWVLNDFWPGAGWGVLDSDGNPKAAYYYLKRVLQSLSISISDEGTNGLFVHGINETADAMAVKIALTAYKSGQTIIASASQPLTLAARETKAYPLLTWFEQFFDFANAYRFGPALADTMQVQLRDASEQVLCEAFHFPLGLTQLPLLDLGLQASVKILAEGDAIVTVQCKRLALSVYFDVDGFIPEDNYFHLAPNSPKTIKMRPNKKRSLGIFGYVGAINLAETVTIRTES